ncbi:TetR/AcrR family transcriptional regulator [Xanthobacter sp. TB0139]|uniref:TetR/AcrR family transcriptional regulator n=1 Tax=Xanthobacter sp. TB0139 TaxID=3459178 RepID=UPI0040399B25
MPKIPDCAQQSASPQPASEKPAQQMARQHVQSKAPKRDSAATRARILDAAREAFARDGFAGARVERIAAQAGTNVQLIYRYFGNKHGLYRAVLEHTYRHLRTLEQGLDLTTAPPREGLRRLVEFTFDYLRDTPQFVAIIRNENMSGAAFARDMPEIHDTMKPLMQALDALMARGVADGVFTRRLPAMDLYLTILALCITHVAQRETLSVLFQQDLGDPVWLARRRTQVVEMVLCFFTAPALTPNDAA